MEPKITFNYSNLNELQIEKIKQQATLGNVTVNLADCSYLISKNQDSNLQISFSTADKISAKSVALLKQLTELLNIKEANLNTSSSTLKIHSNIEDSNLDITPDNIFFILASDRIKSIEQATKLLAETKQQAQDINDKFENAREKGGAYANEILTDEDLLKQYKIALSSIKNIENKLEIETNQLQKIKQSYESYAINIDLNDTELQQSAYDFSCAECHYLEQRLLMEEIALLSDRIVAQAQQDNAAIVFPGRSLVACAAYIEKNYPNVKVIKMPLSGVPKIMALINSNSLNKVLNYIKKYLEKAPKENNLIIVDYVDSAKSLSIVKKISASVCENKTTCIAIYSKHSAVKSNEEFKTSESILPDTSFEDFFQAGNDNYSPLENALYQSTFDEISPYGKYELSKIIDNQAEPYRSQDGFNLLKNSFN